LQDHRVAEAALLVATCAAGPPQATLAVNHLAPFLLTDLLAPLLQATPSSRVVTVSSYMHTRVKDIPWDDLQAEHHYSAAATYNLTKLLNVLFTYELARRWAGTSVTANALHPGWPLKTNLGRDQTGPGADFDRATKLIGSSAAKGARTSLYFAGSPDVTAVTAVTGQYFSRCRPAKYLGTDPQHHRRRTTMGTQRGTLRSASVVRGASSRPLQPPARPGCQDATQCRQGVLTGHRSHEQEALAARATDLP